MKRLILILLFSFSTSLYATTYYVSTGGNDNNSGLSIDNAFLTIAKLLNTLQPGDTGLILADTYQLDQSTQISGTEDNIISIKAYDNQEVVLEGSGNTDSGGRFRIRHDWYHIEGLEFKNGDAGITLTSSASHNTIKNCVAHDCYYSGFYMADDASYNLIINCDSYNMYDSGTNGGNADGFVVSGQYSAPGPGNKFINCRAWDNSDDGFDVWKAGHPVEFENCLSYNNGKFDGDGNGFKLGVNLTDEDQHILKNCLAWNNRQNGFDYNDTDVSQTLYNCTAYNNERNYKFWNINGSPDIHNIQNCISAVTQTDDILLQTIIDQNTNSWNLIDANNATIIDDNFISTDDSTITGARNDDGSIPDSDFLKLKSTSIFIDAGVDVGLNYNGNAPDLGAFESDYTTKIADFQNVQIEIYPNPASRIIHIKFHSETDAELRIFDLSGKTVFKQPINKGNEMIQLNITELKNGVYFLQITNSGRLIWNSKFLKGK